MPARFIDPVLDDTSNKLEQAFADFMKKVERSGVVMPVSDAASSTYVSYEPLERSFVTRQAMKLAHCLEMKTKDEHPAWAHWDLTPNNLDEELFNVPEALLNARENIFSQSVTANSVIANLTEHCDRLKEHNAKLESKLNALKRPACSGETKIIESYQKLIIGMAIGGYTFNPYRSRNSATADIRHDLEVMGLKLDDETVLTHLREAAEVLPEEAKQILLAAIKPLKANSP